MKVVLFFAALFFSGPGTEEPSAYATMKECQDVLKRLPAVIADHNAKEENKVLSYAAACVPMKKAPAGIES